MGKRDKKTDGGTDRLTRIAVVNTDRCKPKRCNHECKRSCPVVRMGKQCIEVWFMFFKFLSSSPKLCHGQIEFKRIYDREKL